MRLALTISLVPFLVTTAWTTCNVIPSRDRVFPGEDAKVSISRPFARPGDEVVISHQDPVFAPPSGRNTIVLTFRPPGSDAIAGGALDGLAPRAGTGCAPESCTSEGCRCVRFVFPDTDGLVSDPADGLTLTGPVEIAIRVRGREVATIGPLFLGDTGFRDDLFPHFVALPPANRFAALLGGVAGDVLAAEDTAGNLFVPLDFTGIVPEDERRTRFLEAAIPKLGLGGSVTIDVFTVAGQRLPPLARQVKERADEIVGTADTRESVFRIAKGALRPGLVPVDNGGPTRIPRVSGIAGTEKQADPETIVVGERFAVYEARECDLVDVHGCGVGQSQGASCIDLDGDERGTSYFLYALDLTAPEAAPIVVDVVDGCQFAGYPGAFPAFGLYSFSASDELVAFRIAEGGFDLDGNGRSTDVVRSGAFDITQRKPITLAAGTPRQEVSGRLLGFTRAPDDDPEGPDELYWYDAFGDGRARRVEDGSGQPYRVTRTPYVARTDQRAQPKHPFDLAVAEDRLAFVVDEGTRGEDLTGDGDAADLALLVLDAPTGVVTTLHESVAPVLSTVAISSDTLAFQIERGSGATHRLAVAVRRFAESGTRFICDDPTGAADGLLAPSISDALVPCLQGGTLHVLASGDVERNLGLRLTPFGETRLPDQVQVSGNALATGVNELVQGKDLDGDGGQSDTFVLHTYQAAQTEPTNFRARLVRPVPPFLQFIRHGLIVLSETPRLVRTIFRDVDRDGVFEEPVTDSTSGLAHVADNCPTIPNASQADRGGDGLGDACECPLLRVETVRAYAGSRVRVPVDFEPGAWPVATTNFDVDSRQGLGVLTYQGCQAGPSVRTARGSLTCVEQLPSLPNLVTAIVTDAGVRDVPRLEPGELGAFEFNVSPNARGQTFEVCVPQDTVIHGDTNGLELQCMAPTHCGEVRIEPTCSRQGDCNCDGAVNSGDQVCLIAKFFDQSLRGTCDCEDCNLSGRLNAADAPCITRCAFGECVTSRR